MSANENIMMGRRQHLPKSERGAALLAALCFALVFVLCLSSFIALCYTSLLVSTRNIMGSHAIELAEAGTEFALYSSSNGDWTGWTTNGSVATATMTMTASGLILTSSNPTPLNLGNNMNGKVKLTVTNYTSPAASQSITSTATMTIPNQGDSVIRTMTTTGSIAPIFVNAIAAVSGIVKFSGAGTVDSYNSALGTYASQTPAFSAIVLSQDISSSRTVRLNNATVKGYVVGYDKAAPTTTNWLMPTTGSTKVEGASTPAGTNIDTSRVVSNPLPYQPLIAEVLPSGAASSLPPGNCTTPTSNILSKGPALGNTSNSTPTVYYANGIALTNNIVTVQAPVIIILYGNMTISGNGGIQLSTANASSPASLTIFVENGSMALGGQGIVNKDANPLPKRCAILSTNNTDNTFNSIQFTTTQPFTGVIYFPYLSITDSATPSSTIYGSIVGESISFTGTGTPTIHYDTSLRTTDASLGDFAYTNLSAPVVPGTLTETVGP